MSAGRITALGLAFAFLVLALVLMAANTAGEAVPQPGPSTWPTGDGDAVRVLP